jgi:N-methylhydantoinase A/oxoprolinase/acetone carboxylase beta subunit
MNRYVIGIDTGGTFTDGVLLQYRTRKVVNTCKTLTTREDLKIGVINALKKLKISEDYDIRLVGISSTLATNSVAEGKASRVGLLLIGYDKQLIKEYGLKKKFNATKIAYFDGGHGAQGKELKPLDTENIKKWVKRHKKEVDAIAISSYFSPLNPDHENRAFNIVKEASDLPVVMGHQLSTKIDSIKRAATATINASLVAVMQDFIQAVRKSLADQGINAPLMIVRGDGTLMPYTEAVQKPVETVLSGPAASAIGGRFLSKKGNSLVIDVGSTTTDMALVQDNRVVVSEDGARVGDTQTAVEAARIRTISLGCDSRVSLDKYNKIQLGPDKVTPLSQLAMRYENVAKELNDLKNRSSMGIKFEEIEFWSLYKPVPETIVETLTPTQKNVVDAIGDEPKALARLLEIASVYHYSHLNMDHLIQQGYIECSTLTPSDILHVSDRIDLWDKEAAKTALDYICHKPELSKSKFIQDVFNRILSTIVEEIVIFLACQDGRTKVMPERIDGEWGRWMLREVLTERNDFITVNLDSRVPIIGTGAAAEFFIKRASHRVNAHFILPEHYDVANAVGAISGSLMEIKEAIVFTQISESQYTYVVKLGEKQRNFEEFDDACDYAADKAKREARKAVIEAGAEDPYVELIIKKEGSLQRYIARAVGNPKISEHQELEIEA